MTSEEEPDEEEYYTNSEEGFPNIERVLTYPVGISWIKTSGLRIALTWITKGEHVHIQQLLVRYLHQQRIAGSVEDHAV